MLIGLLAALALAAGRSPPGLPSPVDRAWEGEAKYWAAVRAHDEAAFKDVFSDAFLGWSCGAAAPSGKSAVTLEGFPQLQDLVIDGKAAAAGPGVVVTFYRAVETFAAAAGGGQTLVLESTHTWAPSADGRWRLIGGMCRPGAGS